MPLQDGRRAVKVTVAWTGLLAPINQDGSARFPLGLPIALRFALTGASANICDLDAKLFVAPLDADGQGGCRTSRRRPAAGGREPVLLPPDHQPVRDAARHAPAGAGPWQLRVDLGDGETHTQRISFFKL